MWGGPSGPPSRRPCKGRPAKPGEYGVVERTDVDTAWTHEPNAAGTLIELAAGMLHPGREPQPLSLSRCTACSKGWTAGRGVPVLRCCSGSRRQHTEADWRRDGAVRSTIPTLAGIV